MSYRILCDFDGTVALGDVTDMLLEALNARLDTVRIDPGFADFVAFCRLQHIPLSVVSDGLDYAIAQILARAGIPALPIIANRLLFQGDERYAMVSPHAARDCRSAAGTCKCRVVNPANKEGCNILVGDGRSDFCAAEAADFVFAKDALLRRCESAGIPHLAFHGFSHLTELLIQGVGLHLTEIAAAGQPMVA